MSSEYDQLKKEIEALIPTRSHFEKENHSNQNESDLFDQQIENQKEEEEEEEIEPISKKQKTIIDDTRFEKLYDLLEVSFMNVEKFKDIERAGFFQVLEKSRNEDERARGICLRLLGCVSKHSSSFISISKNHHFAFELLLESILTWKIEIDEPIIVDSGIRGIDKMLSSEKNENQLEWISNQNNLFNEILNFLSHPSIFVRRSSVKLIGRILESSLRMNKTDFCLTFETHISKLQTSTQIEVFKSLVEIVLQLIESSTTKTSNVIFGFLKKSNLMKLIWEMKKSNDRIILESLKDFIREISIRNGFQILRQIIPDTTTENSTVDEWVFKLISELIDQNKSEKEILSSIEFGFCVIDGEWAPTLLQFSCFLLTFQTNQQNRYLSEMFVNQSQRKEKLLKSMKVGWSLGWLCVSLKRFLAAFSTKSATDVSKLVSLDFLTELDNFQSIICERSLKINSPSDSKLLRNVFDLLKLSCIMIGTKSTKSFDLVSELIINSLRPNLNERAVIDSSLSLLPIVFSGNQLTYNNNTTTIQLLEKLGKSIELLLNGRNSGEEGIEWRSEWEIEDSVLECLIEMSNSSNSHFIQLWKFLDEWKIKESIFQKSDPPKTFENEENQNSHNNNNNNNQNSKTEQKANQKVKEKGNIYVRNTALRFLVVVSKHWESINEIERNRIISILNHSLYDSQSMIRLSGIQALKSIISVSNPIHFVQIIQQITNSLNNIQNNNVEENLFSIGNEEEWEMGIEICRIVQLLISRDVLGWNCVRKVHFESVLFRLLKHDSRLVRLETSKTLQQLIFNSQIPTNSTSDLLNWRKELTLKTNINELKLIEKESESGFLYPPDTDYFLQQEPNNIDCY